MGRVKKPGKSHKEVEKEAPTCDGWNGHTSRALRSQDSPCPIPSSQFQSWPRLVGPLAPGVPTPRPATAPAMASTTQHSSPPKAPFASFALVRSQYEQISSLRRLEASAVGRLIDLRSSMLPVASDHAITVPLGENHVAMVAEYRVRLKEKLGRLEREDEARVAKIEGRSDVVDPKGRRTEFRPIPTSTSTCLHLHQCILSSLSISHRRPGCSYFQIMCPAPSNDLS